MADIVEALKQLSAETGAGLNPVIIATGVVESVSPVKIRIDQKILLTGKMLRLTTAVKDHDVDITINGVSDSRGDSISGRTTVTVHNGLKIGESVFMIRDQGGQKYTVIDRM
ncbi:MAG: DUF2577 domain-containing protein [Acetobacterium sp.]|uniref:DUF2577 domain-containing protein n=1 Tax=Acetobacterium sp. TaxID=1872094 RepID=UPI003241D741